MHCTVRQILHLTAVETLYVHILWFVFFVKVTSLTLKTLFEYPGHNLTTLSQPIDLVQDGTIVCPSLLLTCSWLLHF